MAVIELDRLAAVPAQPTEPQPERRNPQKHLRLVDEGNGSDLPPVDNNEDNYSHHNDGPERRDHRRLILALEVGVAAAAAIAAMLLTTPVAH